MLDNQNSDSEEKRKRKNLINRIYQNLNYNRLG